MPTLVERLGKFVGYELGFPMINRMSHNYVQAEFSLKDEHYFEAFKYAVKTLFHTVKGGIWLGGSAFEVGALGGIADGIYSGNLKQAATGAGAIALIEIIKDIMNNPQRYSIVRHLKDGTASG